MKTVPLLALAAALVVAGCSQQAAPAQPSASAAAMVEGSLPFEVPQGAQFVARRRGARTVYRISERCPALREMDPGKVVFFWTLEAARRSGHVLSSDEGCR